MAVISVQPFGIQAPGGGPRILRALFEEAPVRVVNVCTSPLPPADARPFEEVHLPARPAFGRFESSRALSALGAVEVAGGDRFARRLEGLCVSSGARAIHAVPHSIDFWYALKVARRQRLPYFLSVHDDVRYNLRGRIEKRFALACLGAAWREAEARFVISEELGDECSARYGERCYARVTDGLRFETPIRPRPHSGSLNVYFTGLFHLSYGENLRALLGALAGMRQRGREVSFTGRCGGLDGHHLPIEVPVRTLPFAPEAEVSRDMRSADLAYMPLPFGSKYRDFVRFSFSTKLVTYLGSGVPTLYHGPTDTAAGRLLREHDAAICVNSLDSEEIRRSLASGLERSSVIVENALRLARNRFSLHEQRARYWGAIAPEVATKRAATSPEARVGEMS